MRSLTWPCVLMLSVLTVSGFKEQAVPFPRSNDTTPTLLGNNSSSSLDPCVNAQFRAPIYQVTNLTWVEEGNKSPTVNSTFRLTLVDIANDNRTIQCDWFPENWIWYRRLEPVCYLALGFPTHSRYLGLLNVNPVQEPANGTRRDKINFLEYYYCDIGRRGSYPEVARSRVEIFLDTKCPDGGDKSTCLVTTARLPLPVKGQWLSRGIISPGTQRIQPKPTWPEQEVRSGLDPPPSKDCTEISVTYPDWSLSDLVYNDQTIGFTLISRASGSNATCSTKVQSQRESLVLTCSPNHNIIESGSKLVVTFLPDNSRLSIQESWTCGDTQGLSPTNFTAIGNLTIPRSTPSSSTINTTVIKGSLIQPFSLTPSPFEPPPNANTPNCTSLSNIDKNNRHTWGLSHFLYKITKHTIFTPSGSSITDPTIQNNLYPTNRTLQITLTNYLNNHTTTCTFDRESSLLTNDQNIPKGWFACPPVTSTRSTLHSSAEYPLTTYLLFDKSTASIQINQTYYCSDTGTPYRITATGRTYPGTYRSYTPYDGNEPRIICGDGTNTARNVTCPNSNLGFVPIYRGCDLFASVDWCSLDAIEDGYPIGGVPAGMVATSFQKEELAPDAFDSPDPNMNPTSTSHNNNTRTRRRRSCTAASLQNPKWTLTPNAKFNLPFATTLWPLPPNAQNYSSFWLEARDAWEHTDSLPTRISFDLLNSVFAPDPGSQQLELPPQTQGTGIINNLGTIDETNGYPTLRSRYKENLAPWSWNWDSGGEGGLMRSYVFGTDRLIQRPGLGGWTGQVDDIQVYFGGWDFYNAIEWTFRVDLSKGYVELSHSWYCDDRDVERPIIFNGTWSGYVPLRCEYNFPKGEQLTGATKEGELKWPAIECYLDGKGENGSFEVTPSVRSYTLDRAVPDLNYNWRG